MPVLQTSAPASRSTEMPAFQAYPPARPGGAEMPVFQACLLPACRLRSLEMPVFPAFLPTSTPQSTEMPAFPAYPPACMRRGGEMPAFSACLAACRGALECQPFQPTCLPSQEL